MPVSLDPTHAVAHASAATNEELKSISRKLDKLIGSNNDNIRTAETEQGSFIFSNKNMVWWQKNPSAATYRLKLYAHPVPDDDIPADEIDIIEIERNKAYHTFSDLVGCNIFIVKLEVEDREGQIIDTGEIKL